MEEAEGKAKKRKTDDPIREGQGPGACPHYAYVKHIDLVMFYLMLPSSYCY